MLKMWWVHFRSWFIHHRTLYLIKRGKLQYGRQSLDTIAKDGGIVTGPLQSRIQVRHRIIVKAKVFRKETGKWEDYGEIVNEVR